jgi:hypothetical protein
VAIERNPIHGALSEGEFLGGVTGEADARNHGMFESRAQGCFCPVKEAAREIFFEGRDACDRSVKLYGGACRSAGDLQFFGERPRRASQQEQRGTQDEFRSGNHANPHRMDEPASRLP